MALLGAILTTNKAFHTVAGFLRVEDFAVEEHRLIYAAIEKTIRRGGVADAVLLKGHFEAMGELERVGGAKYLAKLAASVVSVVNAEDYARTIADRAARRHLIGAAEELAQAAYGIADIDDTAEKVLAAHLARLHELGARGADRPAVTIYEAARQSLDDTELAMKGDRDVVRTGMAKVDALMGGMEAQDLVILAGRPSMGKSAVAGNWLINQAAAGMPVLNASLEMSNKENARRALARLTGVSAHRQRTGNISTQDYLALVEARHQFEQWPYYTQDVAGRSVLEIEAEARRLGVRVLVVDHLGLCSGVEPGQRYRSEFEKITDISAALKKTAKRLNIPVVALSQLSREVEKRGDKRPTLSDLRQSGAIEQDADVVAFVYREEYYLERAPASERDTQWEQAMTREKNRGELIIAKNRGGPIGTVRLFNDHQASYITDVMPEDAAEPVDTRQGSLAIVG